MTSFVSDRREKIQSPGWSQLQMCVFCCYGYWASTNTEEIKRPQDTGWQQAEGNAIDSGGCYRGAKYFKEFSVAYRHPLGLVWVHPSPAVFHPGDDFSWALRKVGFHSGYISWKGDEWLRVSHALLPLQPVLSHQLSEGFHLKLKNTEEKIEHVGHCR